MSEPSCVREALLGLEVTPDGLAFSPGALTRVRRALEEDLGEASGSSAVEGLLRLSAALRRRSPPLADALIAILSSVPAARAAAERRLAGRNRSIDQVRRFLASEGRSVGVRAPCTEEPAPRGSLPLFLWVDPGGRDRARAASRARKEARHDISE